MKENPLASDNSENVSITRDPQSGTNFAIGQTIVVCEAIDGSGKRAACSFEVHVPGSYCALLCMFFASFSLIHLFV